MQPGEIEYEFGVPIPGRILPEAEWARTAVKRLPEPGPLDWAAIFGRDGAGRPGPRLRQRPVHAQQCAEPARITTTSPSTSCRW